MTSDAYHHGDLRRVLLDEAARYIAAHGVAALSLRKLARTVGVSHAAPAHHFADRGGLMTALATEGYELLRDRLEAAGDDGRDIAVAYVDFALSRPGHFAVMFRHDLTDPDDAALRAARAASAGPLRLVGHQLHRLGAWSDPQQAQLAAWATVHGLATLWLEGGLKGASIWDGQDPLTLTRGIVDGMTRPRA